MLKIGLTGGIGSGKSTATERFLELGVPVIDADVIAREVVEPGNPVFDAVVKAFGNQVVDAGGQLNRKELGNIIFENPELKSRLENILHPKIHTEILHQLEQLSSPYSVVDIPLLAESERSYPLDRVLVIDLPEEMQIARTMKRGKQSMEQIKRIIELQASRQERRTIADDIIDNSGTPEALRNNIDLLHQKYLQLARSIE